MSCGCISKQAHIYSLYQAFISDQLRPDRTNGRCCKRVMDVSLGFQWGIEQVPNWFRERDIFFEARSGRSGCKEVNNVNVRIEWAVDVNPAGSHEHLAVQTVDA
jgi:hypothetical protein